MTIPLVILRIDETFKKLYLDSCYYAKKELQGICLNTCRRGGISTAVCTYQSFSPHLSEGISDN